MFPICSNPHCNKKIVPGGKAFITCNSCQRRLAVGFAGQLDIANTDFPKSLMKKDDTMKEYFGNTEKLEEEVLSLKT